MKRHTQLQSEVIEYKVQRIARAKRITLRVSSSGVCTVRAPNFVGMRFLREFVAKNASWIKASLTRVQQSTYSAQYGAGHFDLHKKTAEAFIAERLAHFAPLVSCEYKKVTVRRQRTRWGSCSSSGNLSFNYKILFLPALIADYVIVHELCHLMEMNHSRTFWARVGRVLPEYALRRKELKSLSHFL